MVLNKHKITHIYIWLNPADLTLSTISLEGSYKLAAALEWTKVI